jgi:prolipoprotein diacylglyceryl transferase
MLSSLPSPSSGVLKIGPLSLHAYGVCIALGMALGVWFAGRRWAARGGNSDSLGRMAVWALPAGIIGARIYHVATDWKAFRGRTGDIFKIWEGGLGIWGGVALGTIVGLLAARAFKLPLTSMLEVAAPAIPLAQAVGRWGNWFNQELFGRPSTLPWALEIARDKRPDPFTGFATFHPTFLYESLWNLLVVGLILLVEKQFGRRLKPGRLFAVYVGGYSLGRLVIEQMRTDTATRIFGYRINTFTALALLAGSLVVLATGLRKDQESSSIVSE